MLCIAYEEDEVESLTAILSCAYSYEIIARNIVKNAPDSINHPFYGEWISSYANDEFSRENMILIDTIEKLTSHYTEGQRQHLVDIFVA